MALYEEFYDESDMFDTFVEYEIKDGVGIIPEGETEINGWAFEGCKKLKHIEIPPSVTKIGKAAFYGCKSLTSISITPSVKEIVQDAGQ